MLEFIVKVTVLKRSNRQTVDQTDWQKNKSWMTNGVETMGWGFKTISSNKSLDFAAGPQEITSSNVLG